MDSIVTVLAPSGQLPTVHSTWQAHNFDQLHYPPCCRWALWTFICLFDDPALGGFIDPGVTNRVSTAIGSRIWFSFGSMVTEQCSKLGTLGFDPTYYDVKARKGGYDEDGEHGGNGGWNTK